LRRRASSIVQCAGFSQSLPLRVLPTMLDESDHSEDRSLQARSRRASSASSGSISLLTLYTTPRQFFRACARAARAVVAKDRADHVWRFAATSVRQQMQSDGDRQSGGRVRTRSHACRYAAVWDGVAVEHDAALAAAASPRHSELVELAILSRETRLFVPCSVRSRTRSVVASRSNGRRCPSLPPGRERHGELPVEAVRGLRNEVAAGRVPRRGTQHDAQSDVVPT
jgi:hypothetical protein